MLPSCGGETTGGEDVIDGVDAPVDIPSEKGNVGDPCVASEDCRSGLECISNICQIPPQVQCTPFEERCNGNVVEICNEEGNRWLEKEQCQFACENAQCVPPVCARGERRCNRNDVEICANDMLGWDFAYSCTTECQDGFCTDQVCIPGAKRCSELDVEECNMRGTAWVVVETCEEKCEEGRCVTSSLDCGTAGRRRCNGNIVEECSETGGWETAEVCRYTCIRGACTECMPADRECDGQNLMECSSDGSGFTLIETCQASCIEGECTFCVPGDRRCDGDNVVACNSSGSRYEILSICTTSCRDGLCTDAICVPFSTRCNGNTVQQCNSRGTQWIDFETCTTRCESGRCVTEPPAPICVPGTYRCNGIDREACNATGTEWIYIESCLGGCVSGSCTAAGCVPFNLTSTPSTIRADETSSALIVSDVIHDSNGNPVPDGTLFTVSCDNCRIGASDGDPNVDGIQVRSVEGRIDFTIISPSAPGNINVTAESPLAQRCSGSAELAATLSAPLSWAEDFTSTRYKNSTATTAMWDTTMGMVDPFPSDKGGGQDGDLVVSGTFNINSSSSGGRLFPDGVNFKVTSITSSSATLRGGVGGLNIGDEVILIQLQGPNAGNYEFLQIARIEFSTNTVFFSTTISKTYDPSGGKVMLQRVPRYRNLTVNGTMTANAFDGDIGGVFVVKVLNQVNINGTIDMNGKGFRGGPTACGSSNWFPGESYGGASCTASTSANGGGGGGSYWESGDYRACYYVCYSGWGNPYASGAGFSVAGTAGNNSSQAGNSYGEQELTRLFLGSAGGSAKARCYDGWWGWGWRETTPVDGGRGGGIIYISGEGIAVWGNIRANGTDGGSSSVGLPCGTMYSYSGAGSGGSILLRARSLNVGTGRVTATAGANYRAGANGRIRLDYFGISGTTTPDYYQGFSGTAVMQTLEIDSTNLNIIQANIETVLQNTSGGSISYQISNDGGSSFNNITPGRSFSFPNAGSSLILKAIFNTTSLNPLRIMGIVVTYTTG